MIATEYHCPDCGHEFWSEFKSFDLQPPAPGELEAYALDRYEPLELLQFEAHREKHSKKLACGKCDLLVAIPRELEFTAWQTQRQLLQDRIEHYPFVATLVRRIEETYRGEPWQVELGEIQCPYCGGLLTEAVQARPCKRCGGCHLEVKNQLHAQLEQDWPPVA